MDKEEQQTMVELKVIRDCLRLIEAAGKADIKAYAEVVFEMFITTITALLDITSPQKRAEMFSSAITAVSKDIVNHAKDMGIQIDVMFMGGPRDSN